MSLNSAIASMTRDNIVNELLSMLTTNEAEVSISWYGHRMVSLDGYEGSVEINKLAEMFLHSKPFSRECGEYLTFNERIQGNELWKKLQELYTVADEKLRRTWLVKYLTEIADLNKEIVHRLSGGDVRSIILEHTSYELRKRTFFAFTPNEWRKFWPDVEPSVSCKRLSRVGEVWLAKKEMIVAIYNRMTCAMSYLFGEL